MNPQRLAAATRLAARLVVAVTLGACSGDDGAGATSEGSGGHASAPFPAGDPDVAGRFPENVPEGFALHDLGALPTIDGETEDFAFEFGPETRAFWVTGVTHPGAYVALLRALAPDGTEYVTPDAPGLDQATTLPYSQGFPGALASPNRVYARPRAQATLVPNTPQLAMQPGTWSFRFGVVRLGYDVESNTILPETVDTRVRVGIVERRIDPPEAGLVDVAFAFAPGSPTRASDAPSDPQIQDALRSLDTALKTAGLALGEVTYAEAPDLPDVVELGGPSCLGDVGFNAAYAAAPPLDRPAVSVLVVDGFRCTRELYDAGDLIAAFSEGIPAVPFARSGGLVLGTRQKTSEPAFWSHVLVHEVGHQLGLFHTEERDPSLTDNLADTGTPLPASENVMYWNTGGARLLFSPDQGKVMRLSPLVRPGP